MGLSADKLRTLDEHLRVNYIDQQRYAGVVTGICRHGELIHVSPLGFRDMERKLPVERDTIFRIYSMSKPITSVALMTLYEQGMFQLDDPVSEYIPVFRNLEVFKSGVLGDFQTSAAQRGMTVRDLLSHQSGLTYGFANRTNVDRAYRDAGVLDVVNAGGTLEQMINTLSGIPLEFSPGERWNYSVATDVCGYLIEILSGKTLDVFLEEVIFQPLAMNDTGFYVLQDKQERLATLYQFEETGLPTAIDESQLDDGTLARDFTAKPTLCSGGGGLTSTMDDYMAFCKMILGNGSYNGQRIVSRKTMELMGSNHLPNNADIDGCSLGSLFETGYRGIGFGLGFSVLLNPADSQVPGSTGELAWGGAASTVFWVDREEDLAVVFLTQLLPSSSYNIGRELRTLVYSAFDD